jgi:ABC-type hemin transport system ATPase subunit
MSSLAHVRNDAAHPRVVVRAESISFKTAAEIMAQQPAVAVFIAAFYLAVGVITEIVGKAKVAGKSTFLAHLVGAVLHGRPFLGHPTRQSRVVWLTEERPTFAEARRARGRHRSAHPPLA